VERGANVDAQGGYYGNALQTAVRKGNTDIFGDLVGRGANDNAQGGKYGNTLHAARHLRKCSIVDYLVQNLADLGVIMVIHLGF
jgi:ankyrin repeat protein